jgi:hypothetical protein
MVKILGGLMANHQTPGVLQGVPGAGVGCEPGYRMGKVMVKTPGVLRGLKSVHQTPGVLNGVPEAGLDREPGYRIGKVMVKTPGVFIALKINY